MVLFEISFAGAQQRQKSSGPTHGVRVGVHKCQRRWCHTWTTPADSPERRPTPSHPGRPKQRQKWGWRGLLNPASSIKVLAPFISPKETQTTHISKVLNTVKKACQSKCQHIAVKDVFCLAAHDKNRLKTETFLSRSLCHTFKFIHWNIHRHSDWEKKNSVKTTVLCKTFVGLITNLQSGVKYTTEFIYNCTVLTSDQVITADNPRRCYQKNCALLCESIRKKVIQHIYVYRNNNLLK